MRVCHRTSLPFFPSPHVLFGPAFVDSFEFLLSFVSASLPSAPPYFGSFLLSFPWFWNGLRRHISCDGVRPVGKITRSAIKDTNSGVPSHFTNACLLLTFTILCYDHLLTFEDEINFVWRKHKRLSFFLFIILRYVSLFSNTNDCAAIRPCAARSMEGFLISN